MWFGLLLVVAIVGILWKWIVGAVVVYGLWRLATHLVDEHYAVDEIVAEMKAGLAKRADEQHRQALAGDPRGTFGNFPPAV